MMEARTFGGLCALRLIFVSKKCIILWPKMGDVLSSLKFL